MIPSFKKRDKFWFGRWVSFIICFLIFSALSFSNLLLFNNSYMEEEREELGIFYKQIVWAVKPMLEKKDYETVQKYSYDFRNEDYSFRIFDKNKKLVASSKPNLTEPLSDENSEIFKKRTKILKIYRHSIRERKIGLLKELKAGGETYYIEVIISEEAVLGNIVKAQSTLFILFAIFTIFIIWSFYYVIHRINIPFDYLEDSIMKIANGDLDTPVAISKQEILHELSISISKMAERLKNQIARLKQLEEYKTEFIQNVSHEIKTPVTAINMAMELIEKEKSENLTPLTKECFEIISFQLKYINTLVNDILTLSELEDEKTCSEKNFNYFILNEAINKVISYNKFNGIDVNFKENAIINLYGDSDLISRAVLNILTNAYRYSKSDKVDIILDRNDTDCILQIKDYGIGIDPVHKDKIFEKFYRTDKSRSRAKGGSGLGLAIVKNIVELHNGTIRLESEINKGCNFIITIPVE